MARKRREPEEVVAKLGRVDAVVSQGRSVAEAVRSIGVTAFACHRWGEEFGGLKGDRAKRLEDLEKENEGPRKAVSGLALEEVILREAALGDWRAPRAAAAASITSRRSSTCPSGWHAACWGSIARRGERCPRDEPMKPRRGPTSSRSPPDTAATAAAASRRCSATRAGRWTARARRAGLATGGAEGAEQAAKEGQAPAERRVVHPPAAGASRPRLVARLRRGPDP